MMPLLYVSYIWTFFVVVFEEFPQKSGRCFVVLVYLEVFFKGFPKGVVCLLVSFLFNTTDKGYLQEQTPTIWRF